MKTILLIIFFLVFSAGCDSITPPIEENKVIEITNKNFDEIVLKADFAMVDFYADWCDPCKKLAPIVEEVAKERPDIVVGKVDIDKENLLKLIYQINGIPTLVFFKEGKDVGRIIGLTTKEKILAKINELNKEKKEREDNCEGGVCNPPKE